MADVSEFYGSGSGTLKPHDIDDDVDVTVEGWRGKTWDDGSKSLYLKLAGFDKELRVNASNSRRIAEMFGSNIDGWVGKKLTLFVDKVNNPQGGLVDSIIVKVRRTQRNAPTGKSPRSQQYDERNPPPPLDDDIPF